jgi:hypothetical protein
MRHNVFLVGAIYRKGKIDEALAAFKKFYFEVVHKVIAYLEA